jgi:hypothetical protein
MEYRPVIIIGAPRSGTNMLRDVLTSLPGVATWPCDEINYIWRYGNARYPSDEFTSGMARPVVRGYIRRQFDWVARNYQAHTVVEKTCANSLRIEFVDRIVPEARYIFIRRDGLDAVGSAIKRWKAQVDLFYLARKARFVPPSDILHYAFQYLGNRCYRILSREKRLAFWGPKLDGMKELLEKYAFTEVCALQWKRCVDKSAYAFSTMPKHRWHEVGYEDFVTNPLEGLDKILDFLNLRIDAAVRNQAISHVNPKSIGKGRRFINEDTIHRLVPLIQETMTRHGYTLPTSSQTLIE